MQDLKVSLIQSHLFWENKKKNLEAFAEKIHSLKGNSHLAILPEMFSTGFSMKPQQLAEPMNGPTIKRLQIWAKENDLYIAGSLIIEENGKFFNRLIVVNPDGELAWYDKKHLFAYAGESNYYCAGNSRKIISIYDWKFLPLVCYDLRFPVWSKNTVNHQNELEYDVLMVVANWPERRRLAWKTLLAARAIENQCYAVGVNRVGPDGNGISHSGDSGIYSFTGEEFSSITPCQEEIQTLELSKQALNEFRRHFPVWKDWDNFSIKP